MAKLILRCNYLKNAPTAHLHNFIHYLGTRDGVEKVSDTNSHLPATAKQTDLIREIISKVTDTKKMHEYHDYLQNPSRGNASEFITQALEQNMELIAKKKNYIDYLANRPRAEKLGTHGLFSDTGEAVVLSKVADEVASHPGVIWTNVISLRREDAERLGFDRASQWQPLLRSRVLLLAENFKIDSHNLKWYAAFHNESHHPHVHLVVYSQDPQEGYLTRKGIDNIRSALAHDIFRQDFMNLYEQKNENRKELKEQAEKSLLFLLGQMRQGVCRNKIIEEKISLLSKRLMNIGGRKVYGYLKADVKATVNSIVEELAKESPVAACYQKWLSCQEEIYRFYKDTMPGPVPLSEQPELKSIKNAIIREAVKLGEGGHFADDGGLAGLERQEENRTLLMEEPEGPYGPDEIPDNVSDGERPPAMAGQGNITAEPHSGRAGTIPEEPDGAGNSDPQSQYYAEWTAMYKEAQGYLYGTAETEPDFEAAYETMKEEAGNGNALALSDMGKMHQQGIFVAADEEAAQGYFAKSLAAFRYAEDKTPASSRNEKNKPPKEYLQYRIGKQYQRGLGTKEDCTTAADWFHKAAGRSHKYAQYSLGLLFLHGKGVEQNHERAFDLIKKSHSQTNAYASFELAKMYEQGTGTGRAPELAGRCYQTAFRGFVKLAEKSKDDNLLYRIGAMHLHGKGTEKNEPEAEQYFLKSAKFGNLTARYQLARIYIRQETDRLAENPQGQADYKKINQALTWLAGAADKGNPFAAYAMGKLHADGILMAKDMDKAIAYLTSAARQGNQYAQYRLGRVFLSDEYRNIPLAADYLTAAAGQHNHFAAYRLGKLYLSGEGIPKDVEKAIQYLTISAGQGNPYAQYLLGKLYLIGKELPKDQEKGFGYLRLSAGQGNIYAAYLLEHWQDGLYPDLLLMATRLLHHMEQAFSGSIQKDKPGGRGITDRKQRRKTREKKISQGHARDDHAGYGQQVQY